MRGVSPTPTGDFKVLSKARNVTLKGKDYESFVSYWIAFKGNSYGLHDASWQSAFGGNRYKTGHGSHGCINLPEDQAALIYNTIDGGYPIIIY